MTFKKGERKNKVPNLRKVFGLMILIAFLSVFIAIPGCVDNSTNTSFQNNVARPDPETGLDDWIFAINDKNVPRLYDLAPRQIKDQISLENFTQENKENPLLQPGVTVKKVIILNETEGGDNAMIVAGLNVTSPSASDPTGYSSMEVFWRFVLFFEENEWKVWTIPF